MSAPSRRRQGTPAAECRCPHTFPRLTGTWRANRQVLAWEHHPLACGLPDRVEQEGSR